MLHLAPILALAQTAVADDSTPWWITVIVGLAGTFGTAFLALLGKYFGKLMDLAAEKSKLAFLANVDEVVMGCVVSLYNTQVEHWKAANSDGKLTDDEKERAKDLAIDWAKSLLDTKKLGELFGPNIATGLGSRVERAVTDAQNAGKMARPIPTPPTG